MIIGIKNHISKPRLGSKLNPAIKIINDGNTLAWYDISNTNTILKDGSNYVSRWNDRLLSGRDLIQLIGGSQPIYSADGIAFDGIDDSLEASFNYSGVVKLYLVFKLTTWVTSKYIYDGAAPQSMALMTDLPSPKIRMRIGGSVVDNNTLTVNKMSIAITTFKGLASVLKIDALTPSLSNLNPVSITGFKLGSISNCADMVIKEVIIRTINDDSTNEEIIYSYLKSKHSL